MRPALLFCLLLICQTVVANTDSENPMHKLDWLIGDWSFVDESIKGDYRETGTRSCRYVMNDSHILCESRGRTATGPERVYLWYFNFNDREQRYEGIGIFSNYPRKQLYELSLREDGHVIELATMSWEENGVIADGNALIRYNGTDEYIWNSLGGEPDPNTGEPTVSFRDQVTRISP